MAKNVYVKSTQKNIKSAIYLKKFPLFWQQQQKKRKKQKTTTIDADKLWSNPF